MNGTPDSTNWELRQLVDAACENTLTEPQARRLEELITADENALEFYVQSVWMHDSIERHSSGFVSKIDASLFESQATETNLTESGIEDMDRNASQLNVASLNSVPPRFQNPATWLLAVCAALAIALVSSLLVGWLNSGPRDLLVQEPNSPDPIPSVILGQQDPGVLIEAAAVERHELTDGTIVIARPGARFEILEPRKLNLESGEIYLLVAKSDRPFVVFTSDGEVQATGTRFTVSTAEQTRAAVAQGRVVMQSSKGKITLGVGQEGTLIKAQPPTRKPAQRISHLVNWAREALQQEEMLVEATNRENGLIAIDPYGQEARLTLRKYNVDIYIEDGIARTTIDQTFFNHNPWNTEGTFYFPLPPDASVSRLAMYVAGQLNEGGMVSRDRGQEIYTEILYQRRDPALLEMMEGNQFKMRIFPLEGRQEKRIFLSYTQTLDELYGTLKYWFPMDHTQDLANQISIKVRVKDGAQQFDANSSTHDFRVANDGDDLLLHYTAEKTKPDQDFLLTLSPNQTTQQAETRVAVCQHEGQHYLSARFVPDLSGSQSPEPRQWIVLNDVSASRSNMDLQAQRYILERLINEADDEDTVFLMDLNTEARNVSFKPANVRSVDVKPLLNHRAKRLIGATNIAAGLDAVQQVIREHDLENPHLVYLGDGVATDGEKAITELPRLIPNRCKFIGIGVGKKVDSMFLQEAADQTGGLFTSIHPNEDIDWRVFDLLASLNTQRMSDIRVSLLDADDQPIQSIVYPSSTVVTAGESLTVTALCDHRLPARIQFSGNIDQRRVTKFATVNEAKTGAGYIPRLWAKLHIDSLLRSGMSNQEEIIALSKAFYVVTPFTSLIVLEDDAMYQEYDVERGRKDHWASYDAPRTIDVVKEPVDWNRWGWGWNRFDGADAKIEVNSRPQTIQEIVDNIQLRINAPFYVWPESPRDSRWDLYQICDAELDADSDPTQLLTLWFLLASGQRESVADWSRGLAATRPSQPNQNENDSAPEDTRKNRFFRLYDQPVPLRFEQTISRFSTWLPFHQFGDLESASNLSLLPGLQSKGFRIRLGQQQGPSWDRFQADGLSPIGELLQTTSRAVPSSGLNPELEDLFNRAVETRWSRIQSDIRDYNQKYGNGRWEGWNHWHESIDFGAGSTSGWQGNSVREILREIDGVAGQSLLEFKEIMPDLLQPQDEAFSYGFAPIGNSIPSFQSFNGLSLAVTATAGTDSLIPMGRFRRLSNRRNLGGRRGGQIGPSLSARIQADPSLFAMLPSFSESRSAQSRQLPANLFLAASAHPVQAQPGMASILAADHLHKRLVQLNEIGVLNKRQLVEKKAIETAIAQMQHVGANLESSASFWGYSGWSYQPRPHLLQAPTIQAYPGYTWSFDLTRYCDGLYSNGVDMVDEVTRQYAVPSPAGKIDETARKLLEQSRANFQPVAIRYEGQEFELNVGPNDRFALSSRNEMYLREKLVCDGTSICQFYDELGLVARRRASEMRLAELRQWVPHAVESPESMIATFDVSLLEQHRDWFTLKLTPVRQPADADTGNAPNSGQSHASESPQQPVTGDDSYMRVTIDRQGRVMERSWIHNDESILSLAFQYDRDQITAGWKTGIVDKDESEALIYEAKPFAPSNETFSTSADTQVVIDMPLMKPAFYANQLAELTGSKDGEPAPGAEQSLTDEQVRESVRLLRHQILASIQELGGNRWGQGNATAIAKATELIVLLERIDQSPSIGDVTLCGSAGIQISQSPEVRDRLAKHQPIKESKVHRFFEFRYNWQQLSAEFEQETGLLGHIAAYNAAVYINQPKQHELFADNFGDSPLALALASSYQRGFQLDRVLTLNDDPRWSGVALLVAAAHCSSPEDKQKLAATYWKWQADRAKSNQPPVILGSVLQNIKSLGDTQKTKVNELLARQLEAIKSADSVLLLLNFAERVSSWGESELADEAYQLAESKLGIENDDVALLRRFAFGQSLWAGNRYRPALKQFDLITSQLEEKGIPLSPAFCAAMARLSANAGKNDASVEWEERALELEQPYLPTAINLAAFRQRYQWLWNQYLSAIQNISKDDAQRDTKYDALIGRATKTWDRWREVDRDNAALPGQMASLLKLAGRDNEAWEYLSSVIDKKPKDASSYFQVGQWYRGQGNLAAAARWLGEGPQWDTANPRWLFEYGSALKELGRKAEADVQFRKVVDGKWAPGLQNWVERAQNEL